MSKEFKITFIDDDDDDDGSGMQIREHKFRVVIKLDARVDLHHLRLFLQRKQVDASKEISTNIGNKYFFMK